MDILTLVCAAAVLGGIAKVLEALVWVILAGGLVGAVGMMLYRLPSFRGVIERHRPTVVIAAIALRRITPPLRRP